MLYVKSATHIGKRKKSNEDAYYTSARSGVFILCDGMGGHADGYLASQLSVQAIVDFLAKTPDVKASIEYAHEQIFAQIKKGVGSPGMGTTAIAVTFQDAGSFEFAWVGDSRVYVINHAGIRMLSEDHTFVQAMLNEGFITLEEAAHHPYKSVLMQAVGGDRKTINVSCGAGRLQTDEYMLLCSDGLVNELDDDVIHSIITEHGANLAAAVSTLVDRANEEGGRDNISVVLIQHTNSSIHGATDPHNCIFQ